MEGFTEPISQQDCLERIAAGKQDILQAEMDANKLNRSSPRYWYERKLIIDRLTLLRGNQAALKAWLARERVTTRATPGASAARGEARNNFMTAAAELVLYCKNHNVQCGGYLEPALEAFEIWRSLWTEPAPDTETALAHVAALKYEVTR